MFTNSAPMDSRLHCFQFQFQSVGANSYFTLMENFGELILNSSPFIRWKAESWSKFCMCILKIWSSYIQDHFGIFRSKISQFQKKMTKEKAMLNLYFLRIISSTRFYAHPVSAGCFLKFLSILMSSTTS